MIYTQPPMSSDKKQQQQQAIQHQQQQLSRLLENNFQFPSCLWAFSWHRLLLCVFNQIIMTSKQNTDGSTSPPLSLSFSASASASAFTSYLWRPARGVPNASSAKPNKASRVALPTPTPSHTSAH